MTAPIRAWHNRTELKTTALEHLDVSGGQGLLAGLTARRLAEERGVPLTTVLADAARISWIDEAERAWGLSVVVGGVLERCFQRLASSEAAAFATSALSAIPVGADLDNIGAQWILGILTDEDNGVRRYTTVGSAQRDAVDGVAELFQRKVSGADPTVAQWSAASVAAAQARDRAPDAVIQGATSATAAAATVAASAYAPDLIPPPIRMNALRAASALPDAEAAAAFEARYLETEAITEAAQIAADAVRADADRTFQRVLAPLSQAAQRARAAGQAGRRVNPADAAALNQVRDAADAAGATAGRHYQWRANLVIQLLRGTNAD